MNVCITKHILNVSIFQFGLASSNCKLQNQRQQLCVAVLGQKLEFVIINKVLTCLMPHAVNPRYHDVNNTLPVIQELCMLRFNICGLVRMIKMLRF